MGQISTATRLTRGLRRTALGVALAAATVGGVAAQDKAPAPAAGGGYMAGDLSSAMQKSMDPAVWTRLMGMMANPQSASPIASCAECHTPEQVAQYQKDFGPALNAMWDPVKQAMNPATWGALMQPATAMMNPMAMMGPMMNPMTMMGPMMNPMAMMGPMMNPMGMMNPMTMMNPAMMMNPMAMMNPAMMMNPMAMMGPMMAMPGMGGMMPGMGGMMPGMGGMMPGMPGMPGMGGMMPGMPGMPGMGGMMPGMPGMGGMMPGMPAMPGMPMMPGMGAAPHGQGGGMPAPMDPKQYEQWFQQWTEAMKNFAPAPAPAQPKQ